MIPIGFCFLLSNASIGHFVCNIVLARFCAYAIASSGQMLYTDKSSTNDLGRYLLQTFRLQELRDGGNYLQEDIIFIATFLCNNSQIL